MNPTNLSDASASDYFGQMRQAIDDLSKESSYTDQIDAIAASIRAGQTPQAFVALESLKQDINGFIFAVCGLLRQNLQSDLNRTMELIMLRQKIVEGARAYAALCGDASGVVLMEQHLENDSTELITTCIADLDPDRV